MSKNEKTPQVQAKRVVKRAKACLLGKIAADIASRLPKEPDELTAWEKYKLIRSGEAVLNTKIPMKLFIKRYDSELPKLTESFIYPEREEQVLYDAAVKASRAERVDREMAVETAFDRAADEAILGVIGTAEFLDTVERLSQQQW